MPPEVVSKSPHDPQLADRWSMGILLYNMLNGHCPFKAQNQKELFLKIVEGNFTFEPHVTPLARDLITKLLNPYPKDRISPKMALESNWFSE